MGYYTRHELDIVTNVEPLVENAILKYLIINGLDDEISEFQGGHRMELDTEPYETETIYFASEPRKWYSSKEDMKNMSSQFKDVLFELRGEGEEAGDIWKAYYLNGKEQMCKARVMFDKFDESLMK